MINQQKPKAAPCETAASPLPAGDPRSDLVGRIVASRAFAKSARIREFLLFVTEKSLKREPEAIRELEIAQHIFGRGPDFIPTEDSVVRVTARQLRAKLKEYFEEEGRHEPLLLDVPKGAYVPVFRERDELSGAFGSALPDAVPDSHGGPHPSRRWRIVLVCVTAMNVALLAVNLAWLRRPRLAAAAPVPDRSLLHPFLSQAQSPVHVVVSDFSLSLMRYGSASGGLDYSLDQYLNRNYEGLRPARRAPELLAMFDILRTHRITRLGDLAVVLNIQRAAAGRVPLLLRHSRDVSLRDFATGRHILLGNPYSTPWVSLFEDRLNFRSMRDQQRGVGFVNVQAHPGEPAAYLVQRASEEGGIGYARIALVPNTSGRPGVLLIGGVNMVTMEAAGDFLSSSETVPQVLQALGLRSLDALPYFELILETRALDNTPLKARIVATRIIPPPTP